MRITAMPELAVIHEATPRKLGQFYRQNYWHGKHVLRLFFTQLPSLKSLPLVGLSFYMLLMLLATLIVPCVAIALHHPLWSLAPPAFLILPAALLALRKTVPVGRWKDVFALWVLYMTYLIARAASIVSKPSRSHR